MTTLLKIGFRLSKPRSFYSSLLLITCFFISLLMVACSETSNSSPIPTTNDSILVVVLTPTPTPEPTPTPTLTPTVTPIPPTATPVPTPTPIPQPNALLLGDPANPWAEITRYQASTDIQLEDLDLKSNTLSIIAPWFENTSQLVNIRGSSNLYLLKFRPDLQKALFSGELEKMPSLEGGIRAILRDPVSKKIVGQGSLLPVRFITNPGSSLFNVFSMVMSVQYNDDLFKQFEIVNTNLLNIKEFLEQKELSVLEGNINYLKQIYTVINQQNLQVGELGRFRSELEAVERQTLQNTSFYISQMQSVQDKYGQVNLDKILGVFRNEDKINELKGLITDFKRKSDIYLFGVTIRGFGAELICALPESRQTGLVRLEKAKNDLDPWLEMQTKFYDLVANRTSKMDGWFTDSKTQDWFKDQAKKGKEEATKAYSQQKTLLGDALNRVKDQIQNENQPLTLVVELDGLSKIKKVSRLITTG